MDIFIETERLMLRRFTRGDVDLLVELDSDPAVMRYLSGGPATSLDEIRDDYLPAVLSYYDRSDRYGYWAAIERATGAFVGWFHLRSVDDATPAEPELGYRLRRSAWGKGYATEGSLALIESGFGDPAVTSISAAAFADHAGSRRVMEKVGMRLVRSYHMSDEELHDELGVVTPELFAAGVVEYVIDRDEWVGWLDAAQGG